MVSLYCTLIINKRRTFDFALDFLRDLVECSSLIDDKRRTFDQVPEKIQGEVETRLRELGYDVNGDPVAGEV